MRKLSLILLPILGFVFTSARIFAPNATPAPSTSPHGDDFKVACDACHSAKSGWKLDKEIYSFNHNEVFPLEGKHIAADCKQCHPTLKFNEAKTACVDCHQDMHGQTVGLDCGRCHTPRSWIVNNITQLHQQSRFPLVGPHYTSDCGGCHKSAQGLNTGDAKIASNSSYLRFDVLGTECYDCHQNKYNATQNPNHVASGYSKNCTDCHSMTNFDWGPNINHSFFLLTQGHSLDCKKCHTDGTFSKLPMECFNCHQTKYAATTNPNHTANQIPTTCEQCHTTNPGWRPATFNHGAFPMTLGHAGVACNDCHKGNYNSTSPQCVSCHQANYNASTNPNHITSQFPTTCEQCHTTTMGWKPATFNHTNFELTLGHANVECSKCHPNGNYSNTPTVCYGCHQPTYEGTTNPNHVTLNLSTNCTDCHTTNPGWKPATFTIHDTYFPIYSGKHRSEWNACTDCHPNTASYSQFTCITCHPHNNKSETDSKHSGVNGYAYNDAACYACHPKGNAEGSFNHNTSPFPLTGAHSTTPCADCHVSGYQNTSMVCSDCHITSYNQTANPNHVTNQIPTTCGTCHTTTPGWKPAAFPNHGNYYALVGSHTSVTCEACHQSNYNTTPNTCVGCHLTKYNQTTNPNHLANNIPNDCGTCHTPSPNWKPATFPIHNNYYILAGAHATVACATCHNGNYNNQIPTLCYGCHTADYNQTNNPPHASAQFPTACDECHTQTAWVPSTFQHDGQYFPIYSGKHNGKWTLCSDCHTNSSNYAVFSCIDCHTHNQTSTNNKHNGVPGYQYNSNACYNCHPTGNAGKMFRINNNGIKKD
ncbi:MAG: hypothetical protein WCL00_01440 [Bacteroidota bacterium]